MATMPRHEEVTGYLQAQGWIPQAPWGGGTVWSHGEFEVLVPGGDVVDYRIRMRELVLCLADFEQRSLDIVVRDIVSGGVDVIGYRAGHDGDEISLETGAAALAALRSLLASCVDQAAEREIAAWSMRRYAVAQLLAATTLLPHRDSFGFDVFLGGPGSRLGRSSAVRLLDAAATVREAAGGGHGWSDEIRHDTIDAFGALGSAEQRPMRFALSFHWSRQVPRPDVVVEFPRTTVEGLGQALNVAVASSPPRDADADADMAELAAVVDGTVVGVDNDGALKAIVRGALWVGEITTGRQRRITVRLRTAQEYARALTAHSSGARVRARGLFDGKRDLQVSENGFFVDGDES
ncbi:hypothetical protein [Nocardia caishijiensis]|uniref:Uncharacterized protein n=1 Tax=Nocardia caishijiensis TaxID=184756 RepID=A0ABQ6YT64_9NOCA|nr:hypothetical protein [Nocardia caishijiensis]KAF0849002.1 hypothetical protein FNL39_101437 [Nocardia caishijiensis]